MSNDVIICSFFTDDDYYRGHAETLAAHFGGLTDPLARAVACS